MDEQLCTHVADGVDGPVAAETRPHRLTGADALMLHLECDDVPMHTLKIVVLDTTLRGCPLTLTDVHAAVTTHLHRIPPALRKLYAVPGYGGRPFLVEDPSLDAAAHLDEVVLPSPTMRAFDDLCAELAVRKLDRDRPLWALTLVHGLPDGQQAVVARVHHALVDGLAALNILDAITSDGPAALPEVARAGAVETDPVALRRKARQEALALVTGITDVARAVRASRRSAREFGSRVEVPSGMPRRTSFNTRSGPERVCASGTLDFAAVRAVSRATGATVNGVLHGLIAGAVREELLARGESVARPTVATFGVCHDLSSTRLSGNDVTPTSVFLRSDLEDAEQRLRETARSCLLAVDLRRRKGFEVAARGSTYGVRLMPKLRSVFAPLTPVVVNHITTANVAGPDHTRWIGDVRVAGWISYAVAIAPADVNLTMYSYDGTVCLGLVATPQSMPDPHGFLARVEQQLALLAETCAGETVERKIP